MDVINKIDKLMADRKWSDYKLAIESGLSSSTIANLRRRNTLPSIPTLEAICSAFGISLAQFFSEDMTYVHLNSEQKDFFDKWVSLTDKQKHIIEDIISEMK